MVGWGIILLILGVGSFLLPMMNTQFKLIQLLGVGNEVWVGTALAAAGLLLIIIGFARKRTSDVEVRDRR